MPYLICDKCNLYYEIQDKSEMDDFSKCECGNELQFYETIEDYMNEDLNDDSNSKKGIFYSINKKNLVILQL